MIYQIKDDFQTKILESKIPVLVEFGAQWCGPCKKQLPILEKIQSECGNQLFVCQIDCDESPQLVKQLGVKSVPALLIFKDGKEISRKIGLASYSELMEIIKNEH